MGLKTTKLFYAISLLFLSLTILCFFFRLHLDAGLGISPSYGGSQGFGVIGDLFREEAQKPRFVNESPNECNVFEGSWVRDDTYPLYESKNCSFLDEGFRCTENGRNDSFYTKWRWQPDACDLPRFNATLMLETIRNRRLVFVGDSIGRNQWESLLCMLAEAIRDNEKSIESNNKAISSSIYEVDGKPITKHEGFLTFRFTDYNCTVEYFRSPFLVPVTRPPKNTPPKVKTTLKLDDVDWTSSHWRHADILVFNTGHWWNAEKTIRSGCYFQEGGVVDMNMDVETAYSKAVDTLMQWVVKEVDPKKIRVFFRSYSPPHYRGRRRTCDRERFPEKRFLGFDDEQELKSKLRVLTNMDSMSQGVVQILNVTYLSSLRKDGHASLYYLGPAVDPASVKRHDCSHWCLPGVPDTWNELLYALLLPTNSQPSDQ